jgi:6-pyruvoyltetrahydropterin/6-carboxytetrahydropterin synthase
MNEYYIHHVSINFKADRALRDYEGPCANRHEHQFKVEADVLTPSPGKSGMVIDFYDIKAALNKITQAWAHTFLNEIKPFDTMNPTNENLAKYCFEALKQELNHPIAQVQSITVWENDGAGVTYVQ